MNRLTLLREEFKRFKPLGKVATILSIVVIVVIAGFSISLLATDTKDKFTEFYVLNENGQAHAYQLNFSVGQESHVIIGINNHEERTVKYTAEAWLVNYTFIDMAVSVQHMYSFGVVNATLDNQEIDFDAVWVAQFQTNFTLNFTSPGNYTMFFIIYMDNTQNNTYNPAIDYHNDPVVTWKIVECMDNQLQYLTLGIHVVS